VYKRQEQDETPWGQVTTLAITLLLAMLEANRRTLRVGLSDREDPE
jgi:hypothetical protein